MIILYYVGSGSGRAVFAAHLTHNFNRAVGIEILKPLHTISNKVLLNWQKNISRLHPELKESDIRFLCGDVCHINLWVHADVVFAHFTSLEEDIREKIATMAKSMRPGTFFISTSHSLPSNSLFDVMEKTQMKVSWGICTVYIHRRSEMMGYGIQMDPREHLDKILKQWV